MTSSTPQQIEAAIAHASREIAALNALVGELPTLQYRLQSVSAGIHLNRNTTAELAEVHDKIVAAIAARDALPVKQSGLKMLEDELQDAIAHQRRKSCEELAALFDIRKKEYDQHQQDLLAEFRLLHDLHKDYLARTGRALLNQFEYMIDLPATRGKYDSTAFRTGHIVSGR